MTRAAAIALPGAEFNDFLFAPIGEDRNGMLVSVLSGLARLDVDPWQEAADLAQLPGETATQRLERFPPDVNLFVHRSSPATTVRFGLRYHWGRRRSWQGYSTDLRDRVVALVEGGVAPGSRAPA